MNKKPDDMRKEYDFSKGERGKFYRLPKTQRLIPLDADIVAFFQKRAKQERKSYQTLINEALRQKIASSSSHDLLTLLQRLVAEQIEQELLQRGLIRSKKTQAKGETQPADLKNSRAISFEEDIERGLP